MYSEKYAQSLTRIIKSDGKLVIPAGHEHEAHILIPDYIVKFCVRYFKLIASQSDIIDPLCGLGTIPRVISEMGGKCIGIELDDSRHGTAARLAGENAVKKGDFLTTKLIPHAFDCIFTSLPFDWFKDEKACSNLNPVYAARFCELLKETGMVLLDSVPVVRRAGIEWSVAERQAQYLENNGFTLQKILTFENTQHVDFDNLSVIMMFCLGE